MALDRKIAIGTVTGVVLLTRAFDTTKAADPARKATLLAEASATP